VRHIIIDRLVFNAAILMMVKDITDRIFL